MISKQKQNLADLIIPEENEDVLVRSDLNQ